MENIQAQEQQYLAGERKAEERELYESAEFHEWLDMLDAQSREGQR